MVQKKVSVISSLYRGDKFLKSFFDNVLKQSCFSILELVLIHNDPSEKELEIISNYRILLGHHLKHIIVPREIIGASWNRGCEVAKGKFLAIWNVNDCRTSYSLESQLVALENNPLAVMSYGDFYRVNRFGDRKGNFIITPKFSYWQFKRSLPQGGVFYMWRKEIMRKIGGFDEQLIAQDFDFSLRIAHNRMKMVRTNTMLGYFTDTGDGLSTVEDGKRAKLENSMLYYRYGIYDKIRLKHFGDMHLYKTDKILHRNEWIQLQKWWKSYKSYRIIHAYRWLILPIRELLRCLVSFLKILPIIHRFQNKYIKRDI